MASMTLVACAAVSGCASDVPGRTDAHATGERADRIIAGTPDTKSPAVVALVHRLGMCGDPAIEFVCSGVLVSPRVVLTAAHCLESMPASALDVFFGASITDGGTRVPVVEGRVHPGFDATTHAFDVAALVLASEAPAEIVPVPPRTTPLPATIVGTNVGIVGFGITSASAGDTGVRRSGTAVVYAATDAELRILAQPSMTCRGDSGSPLMLPTADGEEVIGITSWGDPQCAEFGAAVRVDRIFESFVSPIVTEAKTPLVQRTFDPAAPLCTNACDTHADCPAGTACTKGLDGRGRCTFHGWDGYQLGERCERSSDCTDTCVDTPAGCRCLARCDSLTPASTSPSGNASSCSAGRSAPDSPTWLWAMAVMGAAGVSRRRHSTREKS